MLAIELKGVVVKNDVVSCGGRLGLHYIYASLSRGGGVVLTLCGRKGKHVRCGVTRQNARFVLNRLLSLRKDIYGHDLPGYYKFEKAMHQLKTFAEEHDTQVFDHPCLEADTQTGLNGITIRSSANGGSNLVLRYKGTYRVRGIYKKPIYNVLVGLLKHRQARTGDPLPSGDAIKAAVERIQAHRKERLTTAA